MAKINELIGGEPIEIIKAGVIDIPGVPYKFNYIAGALGMILGGNDLLSGIVAGFAVPLALPPNDEADDGIVDDDGTVGGDPDPGDPDPQPDPDPDPEPDPDPDPDPDPVPLTPKQALARTKGSWSESASGAYIEVTTSDRFVSFKAAFSGEKVVMTMDEVKSLSPNNVRFVGLSRTSLSSEVGSSFGVDVYTLMTSGHKDVYGYSTGFYLLEALDRDRVISGYPTSLSEAKSFVDIDTFFVQATRVPNSRESSLTPGHSGPPGESSGTQRISEDYSFSFGSSGDQNGIVSPLSSVGDVIREMIASKNFMCLTDGEIWFAPYNAWGRASTKKYVTIVSPSSVLRAIHVMLKEGGEEVSFDSLEAMSLHYIDNPVARTTWDAIPAKSTTVRLSGGWSTRVSPFLRQGQHPL